MLFRPLYTHDYFKFHADSLISNDIKKKVTDIVECDGRRVSFKRVPFLQFCYGALKRL